MASSKVPLPSKLTRHYRDLLESSLILETSVASPSVQHRVADNQAPLRMAHKSLQTSPINTNLADHDLADEHEFDESATLETFVPSSSFDHPVPAPRPRVNTRPRKPTVVDQVRQEAIILAKRTQELKDLQGVAHKKQRLLR